MRHRFGTVPGGFSAFGQVTEGTTTRSGSWSFDSAEERDAFDAEQRQLAVDDEWLRHQLDVETAARVRGRHYLDWLPTLDEWRTDGRDDDALQLLLEIVDTTLKPILLEDVGTAPPAYVERAAIIYHRRKQFHAEARLLDRFFAALPPGGAERAARFAALKDRLVKAQRRL